MKQYAPYDIFGINLINFISKRLYFALHSKTFYNLSIFNYPQFIINIQNQLEIIIIEGKHVMNVNVALMRWCSI